MLEGLSYLTTWRSVKFNINCTKMFYSLDPPLFFHLFVSLSFTCSYGLFLIWHLPLLFSWSFLIFCLSLTLFIELLIRMYVFLCSYAHWTLYQDSGDQCSQLVVATLVPSTPICYFFNIAKLQCKQTMVTDFCISFVNNIHIIGKGMIKETWIAKIKEMRCWTEELITFCPISPVSSCSKKLSNFAVMNIEFSLDFEHDIPHVGRLAAVNSVGGLDTRPSSLYWQIEPGVFLR